MKTSRCRVAVIGAGPAGLAVATELARLGVQDVVVLEREAAAGGIPRHCGHSWFGLREFFRPMSGPGYAGYITHLAGRAGAKIRLQTTVVELRESGKLLLSTPQGMEILTADKIVLGTGNRETPRAARLISGARPLGIVTTGALQSMLYLKQRLPFRQPLIVGSELVSFSAMLSCRHAGIKPAAMIASGKRVSSWRFAALLPALLSVPLYKNSRIIEIRGRQRVAAAVIADTSGVERRIDCDGVIFSGRFVAEAALIRASHLQQDVNSGGPLLDQFGRCTDTDVFACGNLTHPVDTAGWCRREGRRIAGWVKAALDGLLPADDNYARIECSDTAIKYFTPQRIALSAENRYADSRATELQLRFNHVRNGRLVLRCDGEILGSRRIHALPERRVLLPLPSSQSIGGRVLSLEIQT